MKRRNLFIGIPTILLLLLLTTNLYADSLDAETRGTIRGGVYEDLDGDGNCEVGPGAVPVPGATISLVNTPPGITLFTGADGTYGLAAAGQGVWQVSLQPGSTGLVATSANPLTVTVSPSAGLVQTDVNFCVEQGSAGSAGNIGLATYAEILATLAAAGMTNNAAVSEALLTAPPGPAPTTVDPDVTVMPPDENAPPPAVWLAYLNHFREMGALPLLAESAALTNGSQLHSRYMVVNDRPIAHAEDTANPLYDPAGHQAAVNGNIFATSQVQADHVWAINFWVSAPFHLVPILDPELGSVGYGHYNQDVGTFHMAAVLDVRSELGDIDAMAQYPVFFPGDGAETWVVRHSLFEWPDPLTSCAGYSRPTGPPIVLQLGSGSVTPNVTGFSLSAGGQAVEACLFHEGTYVNADQYAQQTGRVILNERDAIVIMPRQPLVAGQQYDVQINTNGQTYAWHFSAGNDAP